MSDDLIRIAREFLEPPVEIPGTLYSLPGLSYRLIPARMRLWIFKKFFSPHPEVFSPELSGLSFHNWFHSLSPVDKQEVAGYFGLHFFGRPTVCLTHDVEEMNDVGNMERVAEIEESAGFRSVWNFVVHDYNWNENFIQRLLSSGHEIGWHGFRHDNCLHLADQEMWKNWVDEFRTLMEKYRIRGGRVPSWMITKDLLKKMEDLFQFDLSMADRPFYSSSKPEACGTVYPYFTGKILEIPTNINYDLAFFFPRKNPPREIWVRKALNIAADKGLPVVLTHPNRYYLHGKERLDGYREFLQKLKENNFTSILPSEIMEMKIYGARGV